MPPRSSLAAALLFAGLGGCEAPNTSWFGEEMPEPGGRFAAWEYDPRGETLDDSVSGAGRPLATGAALHVSYQRPAGYSCVESLVQEVASSSCGELTPRSATTPSKHSAPTCLAAKCKSSNSP